MIRLMPLKLQGRDVDRLPLRFALSDERVRTGDVFFQHKTSVARCFYDRARIAGTAIRPDSVPVIDEWIFANEGGEITEGTFTNVFFRMEGAWFTPPVVAGLLRGVERARLLRSGRVSERSLHLSELGQVQEFVLANSVRGLCRAALAE